MSEGGREGMPPPEVSKESKEEMREGNARAALENARLLFSQLEKPAARAEAIISLIKAEYTLGKAEEAQSHFDALVRPPMTSDSIDIAVAQAKAGVDSTLIFDDLLESARAEQNTTRQSLVLARIAGGLARTGRFDDALALVDEMKRERARSQALAEIAAAQKKAGVKPVDVPDADEANERSAHLKGALAYEKVALAASEAGNMDQAIEAIRKMDSGNIQLRTVVELAARMQEAEDTQGVQDLIGRLPNEQAKAQAYAELAIRLKQGPEGS